MINNPLVIKLRPLTAGMTKPQLNTLLAAMRARDFVQLIAWFDNAGSPLTPFELEQLEGKHHPTYIGTVVVRWLIGEWERERRTKFAADAIKDELKPIRLVVIDKVVLAGETEFYGKEVFLEAVRNLLVELEQLYQEDLIAEQARLEELSNG